MTCCVAAKLVGAQKSLNVTDKVDQVRQGPNRADCDNANRVRVSGLIILQIDIRRVAPQY